MPLKCVNEIQIQIGSCATRLHPWTTCNSWCTTSTVGGACPPSLGALHKQEKAHGGRPKPHASSSLLFRISEALRLEPRFGPNADHDELHVACPAGLDHLAGGVVAVVTRLHVVLSDCGGQEERVGRIQGYE